MPDPTPDARAAAALEEALRHARYLQRHGLLKLDEIEDPLRRRARFELQNPYWLSDDVIDYLLRLLSEGQDLTPPPRRGRPSTKKRDYWIVQMVARLVNVYGLKPARNRQHGRERPTACGIVAQALGEIGINLTEIGVVTVWSRRPASMTDDLPMEIELRPEDIARP